MKVFRSLIAALAAIPAWIPLLLLPALLILAAAAFVLFGRRGYYPLVACGLGLVAVTLLLCKGDLVASLVFAALYAALAMLLKLLFFIPQRVWKKGQKREKRKRLSKDERMYRKFRMASAQTPSPAPPKVCKFEEEAAGLTAAESGMQLKYAEELLSRLKKMQLAPSDRLETEALSHTLGAYRTKALTEGEKGTLGDCLASILKMTAKYKL